MWNNLILIYLFKLKGVLVGILNLRWEYGLFLWLCGEKCYIIIFKNCKLFLVVKNKIVWFGRVDGDIVFKRVKVRLYG